jgi:hypothetical protein
MTVWGGRDLEDGAGVEEDTVWRFGWLAGVVEFNGSG